jgi:ankyrin repeat protein
LYARVLAKKTKKKQKDMSITYQSKDVFDACENGDIDKIKAIIAYVKEKPSGFFFGGIKSTIRGFILNNRNEMGYTPLQVVCKNGNLKIFRALIASGMVDPNFTYSRDKIPLLIACENNQIDIVRELIASRKGFDINQKNEADDTGLHLACLYGYAEIAHDLMSLGADLDSVNRNGFTPFFNACRNGHLKIVREMLSRKIKHETLVKAGYLVSYRYSPFAMACRNDHRDVAKELVRQRHLFNKSAPVFRPIHIACWQKNINLLQFWIDEGWDINQLDQDGDSPLHMACMKGMGEDVDIIRKLISNGANIEATNFAGETPFHLACNASSTILVAELMKHGTDTTKETFKQLTGVEISLHRADANILRQLIRFANERQLRKLTHQLFQLESNFNPHCYSSTTRQELEDCSVVLKQEIEFRRQRDAQWKRMELLFIGNKEKGSILSVLPFDVLKLVIKKV